MKYHTPSHAALIVAAVLLGTSLTASCSGGKVKPSSSTDKLSVSIATNGINKQAYLPLDLTKQLGYFQEEGLNVKIINVEGGGNVPDTELLAGKVDAVVAFYDHAITIQGQGKNIEAVSVFLQTPGTAVVCRNDLKGKVTSPADWFGLTVGSAGLGSSSDQMLQYLAVKNGLAVSDIKRLGVGAGNSFIVAMTKKTIACGLTTEPTISEVVNKKVGFVLLDLRTPSGTKNGLGGLYPATSLNVRNSSAADNKATVQKMVNAFARTMHWIDTHSAAQITSKMPASYYATSGKSVYVAALTASKEMFTSNGLMPVGGPESVLKVISSFNPAIKGKEIDLSKTYTNSFAEEANSNLFGSPTG